MSLGRVVARLAGGFLLGLVVQSAMAKDVSGSADHPLVGEVRTKGLLACVELCKDKATGELFQPVGKVGLVCRDLCVENGLVMRAIRDGMVLSPPLIVTEEQIDEIVTKARTSLDQTLAAIGRA